MAFLRVHGAIVTTVPARIQAAVRIPAGLIFHAVIAISAMSSSMDCGRVNADKAITEPVAKMSHAGLFARQTTM